jgi:hypothetical protein
MSQRFPPVWRELEELERAQAAHGSTCSKVRFECNDAVADIGRVELTGFRGALSRDVLIEFVCARCEQRHESPRLR